MQEESVYISVGSNIQPRKNISLVLKILSTESGPVVTSSVYQSTAVGFEGDDFLNLVVGFKTKLSPKQLCQNLYQIENQLGRDRMQPKFSSRTMDLDLLLYGNQIIEEDQLIIPRPEILTSSFVLAPLAELIGNEHHPVLKQTYSSLWDKLQPQQITLNKVTL